MEGKTPEYTGSFQYIERCDGLMRSFHNFMVEGQTESAIKVLRSFHSELLPHMKPEQLTECTSSEKKTLSSQTNNDKTKNSYKWFRLLNQIYHINGFGMKMKDNSFYDASQV